MWECTFQDEFSDFGAKVWYWIDGVTYSIVAFVLLVIFNVLIIRGLKMASSKHMKLTNKSDILTISKTGEPTPHNYNAYKCVRSFCYTYLTQLLFNDNTKLLELQARCPYLCHILSYIQYHIFPLRLEPCYQFLSLLPKRQKILEDVYRCGMHLLKTHSR